MASYVHVSFWIKRPGLTRSDIVLCQHDHLPVFLSDHRALVDLPTASAVYAVHSGLLIMDSLNTSISDDTACLACLQWYLK